MRYRLEVYKTEERGWGVRAGEVIPKGGSAAAFLPGWMFVLWSVNGRSDRPCISIYRGARSFVCLYLGELIGTQEGERRGRIYDKEKSSTLFDLDYQQRDPKYWSSPLPNGPREKMLLD